MRVILMSVMLVICATVAAQHYSIGHTSAILKDTDRGNRKVRVEIYYPISSVNSGSDNEDGCGEKFPVICFAHGYLLSGDQYGHLTDMLVPERFIFISLSSGTALFPSHRKFAEDLRFVAGEVKKMGDDPASPLFGLVSTAICLMGHSMGGGAMFLAARENEEIDAAIALTPYDTRPSAVEAAAGVTVPTLIFSGTNDCITPPGEHHLPAYKNCAAAEKTYILIEGGTHCNMGVSYPKCITGEKLARCEPGISIEEQTAILRRYILPWLTFFLKEEQTQGNIFNSALETDSTVTWLRSKPLDGETE